MNDDECRMTIMDNRWWWVMRNGAIVQCAHLHKGAVWPFHHQTEFDNGVRILQPLPALSCVTQYIEPLRLSSDATTRHVPTWRVQRLKYRKAPSSLKLTGTWLSENCSPGPQRGYHQSGLMSHPLQRHARWRLRLKLFFVNYLPHLKLPTGSRSQQWWWRLQRFPSASRPHSWGL